MSWTVVPQNVTKMPRLSYMVPMTAGAAETQLYNMQNRNNCWNANYANNWDNANYANNANNWDYANNANYANYANNADNWDYSNNDNNWNMRSNFMTTVNANEKIIGDKADDAIYRATAAQYMATDLTTQIESLLKSESFIFVIIAVVLIALILVYRSTM